MPIIVESAKGGSGATLVATAIALATDMPTVLVDLGGDVEHALGVAADARPGALDWLRSNAPAARLDEFVVPIDERVGLVAAGRAAPLGSASSSRVGDVDEASRVDALFDWCRDHESRTGALVVVDAGLVAAAHRRSGDGEPNHAASLEEAASTTTVLVTRACYLALRRHEGGTVRPDGVVLVAEPGRALSTRDIERSIGSPVVATIAWDPAVARAIDAGLVQTALPRPLRRSIRSLLDAVRTRHGTIANAA